MKRIVLTCETGYGDVRRFKRCAEIIESWNDVTNCKITVGELQNQNSEDGFINENAFFVIAIHFNSEIEKLKAVADISALFSKPVNGTGSFYITNVSG